MAGENEHTKYALVQRWEDGITWLNSPEKVWFCIKGKEEMILTEDGNFGIGTANPKSKLDVAGDINVNDNRISNYKGFPKADFDEKQEAKLNETLTYTHSFGAIPSFVQVWEAMAGVRLQRIAKSVD